MDMAHVGGDPGDRAADRLVVAQVEHDAVDGRAAVRGYAAVWGCGTGRGGRLLGLERGTGRAGEGRSREGRLPGLRQAALVAAPGEHGRALFREGHGDLAAYAAGGAGDDDVPAGEATGAACALARLAHDIASASMWLTASPPRAGS